GAKGGGGGSLGSNTPDRSPAVRTTAEELLRGSGLGRRTAGRSLLGGLLRLLGLLGALRGVGLGSVVSESGERGGEDQRGDQLLHVGETPWRTASRQQRDAASRRQQSTERASGVSLAFPPDSPRRRATELRNDLLLLGRSLLGRRLRSVLGRILLRRL